MDLVLIDTIYQGKTSPPLYNETTNPPKLFTQNRNASLDFLHLLYFINFASSNQTGKKKNEEQI